MPHQVGRAAIRARRDREPGVVYVDVTTFGLEARDLAERLSEGSAVGLSGRLDDDDGSSLVPIDQFDFL